jgi:predicted nucleic acid-binding protein
MTILLDMSVLVAGFVPKDSYHQEAIRLLRSPEKNKEEQIIPAPILNELFYFASKELGYRYAVGAFVNVQKVFKIEALTTADMHRMQEIMLRYADSKLDFADTAIMAQAERLNVTRVATFDRRDFPIFRPTHCESLELLP